MSSLPVVVVVVSDRPASAVGYRRSWSGGFRSEVKKFQWPVASGSQNPPPLIMLLHGAQSPSHALDAHALEADQHHQHQHRHLRRKRKAESQDNERLSKRLSLLNLGESIYIPFPRLEELLFSKHDADLVMQRKMDRSCMFPWRTRVHPHRRSTSFPQPHRRHRNSPVVVVANRHPTRLCS